MGAGHFRGRFIPKNPEKYIGDRTKIIARSKWERIFMVWADKNPAVIRWSSEEVVVPYTSPVDGKTHRYFVDFYIQYVDRNGEVKEKLIEIKPFCQTIPPSRRGSPASYQRQAETFLVNQAKWEAATKFAGAKKMEFQVVTEHDLGLARK